MIDSVQLSFLLVSFLLVSFIFWLLALYKDGPGRTSNVMRALEITPEELGGFSYRSLALISLFALFLEMMMIRWVSSEIRIFAYFKNLILVSCFLGFGLGCYLCHRRVQIIALISPILVLAILQLPYPPALHQAIEALPQMLGRSTEVNIWGVPSLPSDWQTMGLALIIMVPLFSMVAMIFVPIGQLVGWHLERAPNGVTAYSVNVLASLAGVIGYTLLCFLYQPPAVWMFVAGVLAVFVFWRKPLARWLLGAGFLICIFMLSVLHPLQTTTYWSPYQKLDLQPGYENGKVINYTLHTNDSWYQQIVDLSPEFVEAHPDLFRQMPAEWMAYNMPYQFYSAPPSVLVLGSGMGNDVAAALRNGAGRVVAVEIDPLILKLGRDLHFEHPYQSPRTHVVLNDARSYIQNSQEKFDLIVFSLLDSHTTSSYFSNIRIDNFVYTREAFERSLQLLKPDGLFVVKFQTDAPWIADRLYGLMKTTFGTDPVDFVTHSNDHDTGGHFYISGSQQRIERAMQNPSLAAFVHQHLSPAMEPAHITTDDWPYFYQHEPGVPISVIFVSIAVLITFGWFIRQTGHTEGAIDFHFLLLGAGFMLLEAQIVSRMALLFGTTWVVNSIVVSGLLCLIVAANLLYQRFPKIPLRWAYVSLFISLIISFVVPPEKLFYESFPLRVSVSTIVLCFPVLFAGIVFVSSFSRVHFRGSALGSNLFGSLAGGLLESLSLWFGLKSLIVLAIVIYAGSALVLLRQSRISKPPLGKAM